MAIIWSRFISEGVWDSAAGVKVAGGGFGVVGVGVRERVPIALGIEDWIWRGWRVGSMSGQGVGVLLR